MNDVNMIVIAIIAERSNRESDVVGYDDLLAEMGLDSLDRMEIAMAVEDGLGISIDDATIDGLKTVGDLIRAAGGEA